MTAFHAGDMLVGFDKLRAAVPDEDHIVPGHDPLLIKLHPPPPPDLASATVRLDVPRSRSVIRRTMRSKDAAKPRTEKSIFDFLLTAALSLVIIRPWVRFSSSCPEAPGMVRAA